MKYSIIILSFFLFIVKIKSQNLIPNPSFELYENCPNSTTEKSVKELIPNWYLPTRGTSDYFNSCSRFQANVPNNFIGHMYAKEGQAYTGIILYEKKKKKEKNLNYREYLQTELTEPLQQGISYEVKFHYAIATYSTYAANNIGIYISKEKIEQRRSAKTLKYFPQIKADTNFINITRDIWFEFSDTIIALGGEKYLTVGNFYNDVNTQFQTLDLSVIRKSLWEKISRQKIAYYYIDMISVIMIKE